MQTAPTPAPSEQLPSPGHPSNSPTTLRRSLTEQSVASTDIQIHTLPMKDGSKPPLRTSSRRSNSSSSYVAKFSYTPRSDEEAYYEGLFKYVSSFITQSSSGQFAPKDSQNNVILPPKLVAEKLFLASRIPSDKLRVIWNMATAVKLTDVSDREGEDNLPGILPTASDAKEDKSVNSTTGSQSEDKDSIKSTERSTATIVMTKSQFNTTVRLIQLFQNKAASNDAQLKKVDGSKLQQGKGAIMQGKLVRYDEDGLLPAFFAGVSGVLLILPGSVDNNKSTEEAKQAKQRAQQNWQKVSKFVGKKGPTRRITLDDERHRSISQGGNVLHRRRTMDDENVASVVADGPRRRSMDDDKVGSGVNARRPTIEAKGLDVKSDDKINSSNNSRRPTNEAKGPNEKSPNVAPMENKTDEQQLKLLQREVVQLRAIVTVLQDEMKQIKGMLSNGQNTPRINPSPGPPGNAQKQNWQKLVNVGKMVGAGKKGPNRRITLDDERHLNAEKLVRGSVSPAMAGPAVRLSAPPAPSPAMTSFTARGSAPPAVNPNANGGSGGGGNGQINGLGGNNQTNGPTANNSLEPEPQIDEPNVGVESYWGTKQEKEDTPQQAQQKQPMAQDTKQPNKLAPSIRNKMRDLGKKAQDNLSMQEPMKTESPNVSSNIPAMHPSATRQSIRVQPRLPRVHNMSMPHMPRVPGNLANSGSTTGSNSMGSNEGKQQRGGVKLSPGASPRMSLKPSDSGSGSGGTVGTPRAGNVGAQHGGLAGPPYPAGNAGPKHAGNAGPQYPGQPHPGNKGPHNAGQPHPPGNKGPHYPGNAHTGQPHSGNAGPLYTAHHPHAGAQPVSNTHPPSSMQQSMTDQQHRKSTHSEMTAPTSNGVKNFQSNNMPAHSPSNDISPKLSDDSSPTRRHTNKHVPKRLPKETLTKSVRHIVRGMDGTTRVYKEKDAPPSTNAVDVQPLEPAPLTAASILRTNVDAKPKKKNVLMRRLSTG